MAIFSSLKDNYLMATLTAADCANFRKDLELIIEVSCDSQRLAQRDWLLDYLHGLGFFSYLLPDTHRFRHYAYPNSSRERPRRLREPLTRMHNVIFSRIDADQL